MLLILILAVADVNITRAYVELYIDRLGSLLMCVKCEHASVDVVDGSVE